MICYVTDYVIKIFIVHQLSIIIISAVYYVKRNILNTMSLN